MKRFKSTLAVIVVFTFIAAGKTQMTENQTSNASKEQSKPPGNQKIQVAILLDVSNSMDGLINQAKAQLWNMVNIIGKAKCDNQSPQFEIALYEYGRSGNEKSAGYVKQISPFTTNLDQVSKLLFDLKTNGGDEYCGQVIYSSLNDLQWDPGANNYKVIFIAGNEDFLQGGLHYTKACELAKTKGVIVNTIYCGNKMQGIQEHWNLGAECGDGSFTNINSDAAMEDIPTPYDSAIFSLNGNMNQTYLGYGMLRLRGVSSQFEADEQNIKLNRSAALKRAEVKSKKSLYDNSSWDMVDAMDKDTSFVQKLDMKTLPDSLKNKTKDELKTIILEKANQRAAVQKQIQDLSKQRDTYLVAERARRAGASNTPTLESEIEKLIKAQAQRFRMVIE